MKREPGFYWVKEYIEDDWGIAQWSGLMWSVIEFDLQFTDNHFAVIDERRIVRGNAYVDLSNDALLEAKKELDCSDDTFEWIVVLASWYDIPLEDILEKYRNI